MTAYRQLAEGPRGRRPEDICGLWRGLSALALTATACGSSPRLPPPPPYEPANSPEADTPCEVERDHAKAARERLLEIDTDAARVQAAAAVFAQAECERGHFDQRDLAAPTQEQMVERTVAARRRYRDAVILYEEISHYGSTRWSVGALSRLGELHGAFAGKLRTTPAPSELGDPTDQKAFLDEAAALAATFEQRAVAAHMAALETLAIAPALVAEDEAVRAWTRASCRALGRLDPSAFERQVVCSEWPRGGGQ